MFEGDFQKGPQDRRNAGGSNDAEPLRELSWSDLRARLEAARDLRTALADEDHSGPASFDAGSARRIAAISEGKHCVNPDDLANGKASGDIEGSGAAGQPPMTRGS